MKTTTIKHFLLAGSVCCVANATFTACQSDDRYTLEQIQHMAGTGNTGSAGHTSGDSIDIDSIAGNSDTIHIVWKGTTATVADYSNERVSIAVSGADVTVTSTDTAAVVYRLSGSSADGQLLIYSQHKLELILDNLSLTNTDGPAINNQCGKSLFVTCPAGTVSTLTDGTTYADAYLGTELIDQKATLFSEGQILFRGDGTLNVNANAKNAIASDDYIVMSSGAGITVNATTAATGSNGLKMNDGMFVYGGTLNINVAADGAKGIKCDSTFTMTAGTVSVTTTGASVIETDATTGLRDTSSCAGIKVDRQLTLSGGTLTLNSTGEGGKGINAEQDIVMTGGTLTAICTGEKDISNPKAVKTDTYIYLSGGSFTAQSTNGRATDCATADRYPTIDTTAGQPTTLTTTKHSVVVSW
ncbi:MAG: carbohydrate-binding domain-containing protein [Prevotella sp.]|nr:carbohydrate-binding domain-containing protein [Prevotella sp.]